MPAGRKPKFDLKHINCPNPECPDNGKSHASNIVANGTYKTSNGVGRRYKCKICGASFTKQTGDLFEGVRSSRDKVIAAFRVLSKGVSIRKAARLVGVKPDTVRAWIMKMSQRSEHLDRRLAGEIGVSKAELEEFWGRVKTNALRRRAIEWRRRCGWRKGWD